MMAEVVRHPLRWTTWAARVMEIDLVRWILEDIMQGHYGGALIDMSFMGILGGVPSQGCCANGLAKVTWIYFAHELMGMLCTFLQQGHGFLMGNLLEYSCHMECRGILQWHL